MRQDVRDNQYTERSPCFDCERRGKDKNECLVSCVKLAIYRGDAQMPQEENKTIDINELRTILVAELRGLQAGTTTPDVANAITNVSGKIMATVKLEMEYCKMVGKTPEIDFITIDKKKLKGKK